MTPVQDISVREIVDMLRDRFDSLVEDLFPLALKKPGHYSVGSLDGERGKSLVLWRGHRAGAWKDYSTQDTGDPLTLIERAVTGGNKAEAIKWARGWLGLQDISQEALERRRVAASKARQKNEEKARQEANARKNKALAIFIEGDKALRGTPVDMYLQTRGINLRAFPRQPGCLRYHPACWNAETRNNHPAMLSCVTGPDGFMAIHRTYLRRLESGRWDKASVEDARKVYGDFAGGSIPVWRGETGKPLKDAEDGDRIILTEGVEDALSMARIAPDERVHAAVSLGNLGNVWLPPTIKEVVLCRDNDWDKPQAVAAFDAAMKAHAMAGRTVTVFETPQEVGKDPNDYLKHQQQRGFA